MLELNIVFIKKWAWFFYCLTFPPCIQIRSWLHAKTVFNIQYSFPILALCQSNIEPTWFDFLNSCSIPRNLQVSTNNFNSKLVLYGVKSKLQLLSIRPRVFCDKHKYATVALQVIGHFEVDFCRVSNEHTSTQSFGGSV